MCDYGVGVNITPKELEDSFDMALSESKEEIRVLLLNSFGSVLDQNEISEECFFALLQKVKKTNIKNIIFETHYSTITSQKLELIRQVLGDRNITFEFGLETSNEYIREHCLLKYINNKKFIEIVDLVHSFNMKVIANIIVGIPFLSDEKQIKDAVESIEWCFINSIDEVDLFPMNIRPYTLLKELYEEGEYSIISHWMLIEVLSKIPSEYLKDIYICWYGNRDLKYDNGVCSLFPTSCKLCEKDLAKFYKEFLKNKDSNFRKRLIDDLIAHKKCSCYKKMLK